MAWSFADSFDLYATSADAILGYWDSGTPGNLSFVTGRFAGSRAIVGGIGATYLVKNSGANDAVHHLCVAYYPTVAGVKGFHFQFSDGATVQCTIVMGPTDIKLYSGSEAGTLLVTYTNAMPAAATWYQFEFEVVINNTTGSFKVRKNGNTTEDFTATGLNTRPGANAYANRLSVVASTNVAGQIVDDLFWRSDASSVAWMGDIRCYTRMPVSDQSVTFAKSGTSFLAQAAPGASGGSLSANNIRWANVVSPTAGTLTSLVCNISAGITGRAKMALYDSSGAGGIPGTLVASSAELTNPGAGLNTFTVTGGPIVTRTTYWVALWSDVAITSAGSNTINPAYIVALSYTGSFPTTMTGFSTGAIFLGSNGMNVTSVNAGLVADPQQDATATYVYSSNPGDTDFYNIAAIAATPATVLATVTRAFMQKSDAGTRTAAVQLKSGGTTVASPTLALTPSNWQWAWRMDLVDPATSAAWTAAAVNSVTIGPAVVA